MPCCPLLRNGHCLIATALRLCRDGGGRCVVLRSRCCGTIRTLDGSEVPEWELCEFYRRAADCRDCRHYDPKRKWCRRFNKPVRYYTGMCYGYEGPRPPPHLLGEQ